MSFGDSRRSAAAVTIQAMTHLMPGVKREDLAPAQDPNEGERIAKEAARRLSDAYRDRLRQVVLFGSWVRGQAHEESDVDLLVVLDDVVDRACEGERIVDALFDVEADSGRAIDAFPAAEADVRERSRPLIRAALDEGLLLLRDRP
jgi:predicted nucleotidyltransferase